MSSFSFNDFNGQERFREALSIVLTKQDCPCSYILIRDELCYILGRPLEGAEKARVTYLLRRSDKITLAEKKMSERKLHKRERKRQVHATVQRRLAKVREVRGNVVR